MQARARSRGVAGRLSPWDVLLRRKDRVRRYLRPGLDLDGFFDELERLGIRYAVLRWFDSLPAVEPGEDVDVLVADEDLPRLKPFLRSYLVPPPTQKFDVYSVSGEQAAFQITGELPEGDYRLTIQANDISNAAGQTLTSPLVYDFYVLRGDADRDRDVDFSDLLTLARNYNQGGRTFSQGNFNYSTDGKVDFDDLLMLARNYNKKLPAPTAAVESAAAASRRQAARETVLDVLS